jgi:hypothetical protein
MASLRTNETKEKYKLWLANNSLQEHCPLCAHKPLRQFTFWKIVMNDFPYDKIANVHHMLVPLRHTTEAGLSGEEMTELLEIKGKELGEYQYSLQATTSAVTIPGHFHLHLLDVKDF